MGLIDCLILATLGVASALSIIVLVHRGRRYSTAAAAVFVGAGGLATVTLVSAITDPSMQVHHEGFFRLLSWIGICFILGRLAWTRS